MKKKDALGDWLVLRMSYTAEDPVDRIDFLMNTQKEVWRSPVSAEEKESWLNLLLNQGYYQLFDGDIIGSIDAYESANSYYRQHPITGFDVAEYLYKPLGNNYTRLGDYSSALYIQKMGLEYALKNRKSDQTASFYNNLAISYRWLGKLGEAEKMALEGISISRSDNALFALLKCTLADIYFEMGKIKESEINNDEALRILNRKRLTPNEQYWLLSAFTLAGEIAIKKENTDKALGYFQIGLDLIQKDFRGGRRREKANLLNRMAKVFLEKGNAGKSMKLFNESLETLISNYNGEERQTIQPEWLYAENRLYDALEGRSKAFTQLGKPEKALSDMILALRTGDISRRIITSESDKIKLQTNLTNLSETALNTSYHLWGQGKGDRYGEIMLELTEQSKARVLMEEMLKNQSRLASSGDSLYRRRIFLQQAIAQYERELIMSAGETRNLAENKSRAVYQLALLEKELSKKYPGLNRNSADTKIVANTLLQRIPDDVMVMDYFLGKNTGYNLLLEHNKITGIFRLENADKWKERIQKFTQEFFRKGPTAMMNRPEDFYHESNELFRYLVPSVSLSRKKRLLIIPNDVIGYLSFEALICNGKYADNIKNWPFLIKYVPVSYAYSLGTWELPLANNDNQLFSGFFITKAGNGNAELPAAKLEEQYLSEKLSGDFFQNKGASLKAFSSAVAQSNVLHISTHSYPYGDEHIPALEMADGNYFLFQLAGEKKMPGLVVMSACRTADGLLASGEGVLSLSRGFSAAGTNGTIAGLWNVNDNAAAEQMVSFYENLLQNGNPENALNLMKLDWLTRDHSNPALLLPYYWAGMIYTGKPQKIILQQLTFWDKYGLWVLSVTGVLLMVLLWGLLRKDGHRKYVMNDE